MDETKNNENYAPWVGAPPDTVCPKCNGTKHIKNSKGFWENCHYCMKNSRIFNSYKSCNFPKYFEDKTFSDFQLSSPESLIAKKVAEAVSSDYSKGLDLETNLYFWDNYQIYGKLLASLIAKAAIKSLKTIYFVTVDNLFMSSMREADIIPLYEIKKKDLLIIELAKDFMNKKIPSILNDVIYYRFNEKKPIIYNSIYDMSQMSIYYDVTIFHLMQVTKVKQLKIVRQ